MPMLSLKKIDIDLLLNDSNNPRKIEEGALELLSLSLRKFGLLSPIYITSSGKILSGHQRTSVLRSLGEEHVFVCVVSEGYSKSELGAVNFMYNKEIQELNRLDRTLGKDELEEIYSTMKNKLIEMPDVDDISSNLKNIEMIRMDELNHNYRPTRVSLKNSSMLYSKTKSVIPVIINEENFIINGEARAALYDKKYGVVPCIRSIGITQEIFRFITGGYSFKGIEDSIRVEQGRHMVAWSYNLNILNSMGGKKLHAMPHDMRFKYIRNNFPSILDFGSGNGKQSAALRRCHEDYTLFEPFAPGKKSRFSIKETYDIINAFLTRLENPKPFSAVIALAVLNSVPFKEDEEKVCTLLKFLSTGSKFLHVSSRNKETMHYSFKVSSGLKLKDMGEGSFVSSGLKTKIQRFHDVRDLDLLFGSGSNQKSIYGDSGFVHACIYNPEYKIEKEQLLEAVEFEFGLKYNDRVFEGVRDRAIKVFSERYDRLKAN